MMGQWLIYALLAAVSASFVTIFTKLGIHHLTPTLATSVRACDYGSIFGHCFSD